jgi:acid phosphatase type 7
MIRNNLPGRRLQSLLIYTVICGVLLLPAQDKKAAPEKLSKGPVIQNVQTDRATITWVTTRQPGVIQKEGSSVPLSEVEYHALDLTGLEPATHYVWDLNTSGTTVKASFTTAPAQDTRFTFVVFGDTRSRHEVHKKAEEKVVSEKASFVLHTGDLVSNGSNPEDWDQFFEIEKDLLSSVPFYPTPGNHERNDPVYFKYFSFPGGNGHHYSFDWGSVHIVALDTNEIGDSAGAKAAFLREEVEWFRQDLRRNQKPLTFVFMHHPLYTAVESRRAGAARLAAELEPIMLERGVTAVFAGHDHNYQHHLKGTLHFVVTGGGGAPLYDVSPIPGITLKALKTENYVRVRIDGRQAKIEAFDLQGNTIDSFDVRGRQ